MSTLNVANIADPTGTNAMTIDNSGRVLQPAKPSFRVAKTDSDQPLTTNQSEKVTFNNTVFDIGNNFGSDKFIAPIAGIYHFDASIRVGPDTNNASFYNAVLFLNKNGSRHVYLQQISTYANSLGGGVAHMSVCNLHGGVTTSLAAGDEIEVHALLEGSNPEVKSGADSDFTYFSGFLIG